MKHILDIAPIKDEGKKSCIDYLVESVADWKKYDCRLMYLDSWRFRFVTEKVARNGIWKRGEIASYLYFDDQLRTYRNLAAFTGIKIFWCDQFSVDYIRQEIDAGYPIFLFCDTFFLPWIEKLYGKVHSEHCILLVGYDADGYYCNDMTSGYLQREQLEEAMLGDCGVLRFGKSRVEKENILLEINKIDVGMFAQMEEFADYMKTKTVLSEDLESFDGGDGILLRAIRNIVRARRNFLLSLDAIAQLFAVSLWETADLLEQAIETWQLVKTLFYKGYIELEYNRYNQKISNLIYKCKSYESQAYKSLKHRLNL